MKVSDLSPNPKNPRKISDARIALLAKSLEEFGDLACVIYNRRTKQMVSGHQRIKNFDKDSIVEITKSFKKPSKVGTVAEGTILYKGEAFKYREVDWDETKEKAGSIAANKAAGDWDIGQLTAWMEDIEGMGFDLDFTMFDEEERAEMFPELVSVSEYTRSGPTGTDEDEVPEAAPVRAKRGDLFQCGEHRLLCGDSTNDDDVSALMGGEKADICFTSPPYNLGTNMKLRGKNASGKDTAYLDNQADHKTQGEYLEFMGKWSTLAITHAKYLFCNIQMLAGNKIALPEYLYAFRNKLVDIMIWDKEHGAPAMAPNVLNSAWEFIFILTNETDPKRSIKSGPEFRGTIPNIYRLNPMGKKDELAKSHGAVFPVQFAHYFAETFSKDKVLDLFGGSGSTMVACEKIDRQCFMMEYEPLYCDIILARWEKYSGKKAELISEKEQPKAAKPILRKGK